MTHGIHSDNTQTIWTDGCPECDERAAQLPGSIHELDDRHRIQAWHFMRAWSWSGGHWSTTAPSENDQRLFAALYTIGVFLERAGISPGEFERRLIERHDDLAARLSFSIEPIGLGLNGIDITGVFVGEER